MGIVGTAHQYIAKPGDGATLKAAIAQTHLVRSLLGDPELAHLVGQVDTLPSVPAAFQQISDCLREPNSTVTDAAQIIGRDVAMTANIMKLVNSAFFGARRQVTSVKSAVAHLGRDTLSALVMGHGLFKSIGTNTTETLWEHSLRTATAARAIALSEGLPAPRVEQTFLTGMLHDVGRLVYASRITQGGAPAPTQIAQMGDQTSVDAHHAGVGAYLLGLWGFPSEIVAAVALHDTPGRRADRGLDLTVLVHIADRLTNARSGDANPTEQLSIEPGVLEELGMIDRIPRWRDAATAPCAEQK